MAAETWDSEETVPVLREPCSEWRGRCEFAEVSMYRSLCHFADMYMYLHPCVLVHGVYK